MTQKMKCLECFLELDLDQALDHRDKTGHKFERLEIPAEEVPQIVKPMIQDW